MKKLCLIACLLLTFLVSGTAQISWQWAHAGGSAGPLMTGTMDLDVCDITTDKWGNMYVVADMYTLDMYIANQTFPGFGDPDALQTCIACFGCDGTLKWYKMLIGSSSQAISIKTDTVGGVYVAGAEYISAAAGGGGPDSGYIMNATTTDTVIAPINGHIGTGDLYRTMYLLKLDTGGAFNWYRWIEPDTTTMFATNESGIYDMNVDPSGNAYLLCMLKPGLYGGTFVAPDSVVYAPYILKYDPTGVCTGGFRLPITSVNYQAKLHMTRDSKRNRFYLDGYSGDTAGDTAWIGGVMISGVYLACFNDTGGMLWMAHDSMTGPVASVQDRVALDRYGNIYMTGGSQWGVYFNGTEFTGGGAFAIKLDTNGHNVWVSQCANNDAVEGYGIAVSNDTVAVVGMYSTNFMTWGADTIGGFAPYQTFVCRLDANTGAGIYLDTVRTDGNLCLPASGGGFVFGSNGSIAADPFGNFYTGGMFTSQIFLAGDTLTNIGSYSNWWVAKLGTGNCSVPVFELGSTTLHTGSISVFPNPSYGELNIDGAALGSVVEVFNAQGQIVYSGTIGSTLQTLRLNHLNPACYYLRISDPSGNRSTKTFVLQ